ncbi:MAG TPA: DUF222 domain-containing protein [Actinomycetes bacterium]
MAGRRGRQPRRGRPHLEPDLQLAIGYLDAERLAEQYDAVRLRLLAAVDARGAAGAERGVAAPTAGWLRAECRMSPHVAAQRVRTARALYRGPLPSVAEAFAAGEVSYQHAAALADATHDLPLGRVAEADPVLVDAARRLDPPRLRRVAEHLRDLVDPDAADERGRARLDRRGLWLAATADGVDVRGLLDPEAGEAVQAALAPRARPTGPDDPRNPAQRRADALADLARWALRAGDLPQEGGLRPNLTVTVDLDSLQARNGSVGGVGAWGGVLPPETVRRLACDAVVTRAVVRRHPDLAAIGHHGDAAGHAGDLADPTHGRLDGGDPGGTSCGGTLAAVLRAAVSLLPAPLGAPVALLDLGRATRVVPPALRRALALRDGGCVAEGRGRPAAWCDAHHRVHWARGGATSLAGLVLLCRVHHVAAHEGGWQFVRDPASGRVTLVPPARHGGHDPPAA